MKCADFEARLNEVLDLRQSPVGDPALSAHAAACPACRAALHTWDQLVDGLVAIPVVAPPAWLRAGVLADVRAAKRRQFGRRTSLALATAAALVLVAWPWLSVRNQGTAVRNPADPGLASRAGDAIPNQSPVGVAKGSLASQASESYWDLARQTGISLTSALRIVPGPGDLKGTPVALLLPGNPPPPSSAVTATDAVAEPDEAASGMSWSQAVAERWQPVASSTTGAVSSLLHVLPIAPDGKRS